MYNYNKMGRFKASERLNPGLKKAATYRTQRTYTKVGKDSKARKDLFDDIRDPTKLGLGSEWGAVGHKLRKTTPNRPYNKNNPFNKTDAEMKYMVAKDKAKRGYTSMKKAASNAISSAKSKMGNLRSKYASTTNSVQSSSKRSTSSSKPPSPPIADSSGIYDSNIQDDDPPPKKSRWGRYARNAGVMYGSAVVGGMVNEKMRHRNAL